ncbi:MULTISPECIES: diacylglycerol kinase [Desulfosediminicola]|uniref:diacylglycerol kinase n=1 Tax=Desulfosediminicola TaxID=2886823 RepID=UPI0010ACC445|nr:diacylglycerol kinase [Desulfosediminicola ganghwensis]
MKSNKRGLSRVFAAFFYSMAGIRSGLNHEEAFRQEVLLFLLLLPALYLIPVSIEFKALLFSANCLVLVVELLNSAIESVVDLVSPDYNIYAKRAKDMGSAAVLLSIALSGILWLVALYTVYF